MYKIIFSCALALLLSSCAKNYSVSTNLDKKNFQEYFSAAKVKIYQSEAQFPGRYRFVGLVEGQDCQVKAHHAAPDEINARTDARKKAYLQSANAVIFTGCTAVEAKECSALLVCYAKAYQLETNHHEQ
ncbi:Rcs stress response system protein RcsF [Colwelliaceae bacterium 6471]